MDADSGARRGSDLVIDLETLVRSTNQPASLTHRILAAPSAASSISTPLVPASAGNARCIFMV